MVTIRVSEPALAVALRDFFRGAQAIAVQTGVDTVEVHLPGALDAEKERAEAAAYLETWLGMHDGARAELLD